MHFFFYFLMVASLLQDSAVSASERQKVKQVNTNSHCIYCWKEFANQRACGQHELLAHTKDKQYRCACCGKPFQTAQGRAHHQGTCRPFLEPGQMDMLVAGEDIEVKGPDFWCEHCGKGFKTSEGALRHEEKEHGEDGNKNYQCLCCDQPFELPFERNKHQATCYPRKTFSLEQKDATDDAEEDKQKSQDTKKACPHCGRLFKKMGYGKHVRHCQKNKELYAHEREDQEEEEEEETDFRRKRSAKMGAKKNDSNCEDKSCGTDDESFRCLQCKKIISLQVPNLASLHALGSCSIQEITHTERVFKCSLCQDVFQENGIQSHCCSHNQERVGCSLAQREGSFNNTWVFEESDGAREGSFYNPSQGREVAAAAAYATYGNGVSVNNFNQSSNSFNPCSMCDGEIRTDDHTITQQHHNGNHALSTIRSSNAPEDYQYICRTCGLYVDPQNAHMHGGGFCKSLWGQSEDQHGALYQQHLMEQGQGAQLQQQVQQAHLPNDLSIEFSSYEE